MILLPTCLNIWITLHLNLVSERRWYFCLQSRHIRIGMRVSNNFVSVMSVLEMCRQPLFPGGEMRSAEWGADLVERWLSRRAPEASLAGRIFWWLMRLWSRWNVHCYCCKLMLSCWHWFKYVLCICIKFRSLSLVCSLMEACLDHCWVTPDWPYGSSCACVLSYDGEEYFGRSDWNTLIVNGSLLFWCSTPTYEAGGIYIIVVMTSSIFPFSVYTPVRKKNNLYDVIIAFHVPSGDFVDGICSLCVCVGGGWYGIEEGHTSVMLGLECSYYCDCW